MRTLRLLLLTGTVLPGLMLAGPASADRDGLSRSIRLAQVDPEERGPRGGREGGGRGAPERAPPPVREERAPAPERAQPRPERAPPVARERPEPREDRAPAPERAVPQERAAPPAARERPEPREDRAPAARPQPTRPEPAEKPTPPAARGRDPDRPAAPERREAPDAGTPPARTPTPAPARPAPARPAPDMARPAAPPPAAAPAAPDQPSRQRVAPNAAPGVPGRPVERPEAAPAPPSAPAERATPPAAPGQPGAGAPNERPGVPGRPVRRPDAVDAPATPGAPVRPADAAAPVAPAQPGVPPAGGPRAAPDGTRLPAPAPAAPNGAPGVPGRPFQAPGAAPPAAGQPGVSPGGEQPGMAQPNAARPGLGRPADGRPGSDLRGSDQRGDDPHGSDPRGADQHGADQHGADQRGLPTGRVDDRGRGGFNVPGRPGYISGGFDTADEDVRDYDRVRRDRREYNEDGRTYIREPGRIIVRDRDNYYIRHDENERFRDLDRSGYRSERRGADTYTYLDRPGGEQIVTVVDDDGRMLRRYRRFRDGREVMLIDNGYGGPRRPIYDDVVDLPPPDIRIPRERYVVDYGSADERGVYEALSAPPVVAVDRRYTLDQVRYSPQLRARMRSVDIDTINFDTASFSVTPDQAARLSTIAAAINQAIRANPQEVFLIEGYTDAVGADVDNLSLSDRRAQSVATVLTQNFQVPPENLTTQGYGEQNLKVNTQNASRENRRVTVRRITPLLQQGNAAAAPPR